MRADPHFPCVGMLIAVFVWATPALVQSENAQPHWAFLPPQRPRLPKVQLNSWPRNGIDYFILARLEQEHLQPSPPADQTTWLRRVTLDLTGLPPTPADVDAFLEDNSEEGYERVVDRLLASPRFGERMAVRWLDAARYADTSGYQSDGERSMWRWRDWVIDAFNRNLPFDQFTVEQIAGDLLPNATLEQRIATGFNRNHRGNAEGGIIPEEYAVEYVVDRVDTTCTVWLGLTMGCARCHDHKYDPFTQKDFYRLFAFFNNVPEKGRAIKLGNSPPFIKAPTRRQQFRLEEIERELAEAEARFQRLEPEIAAAQTAWEDHFTNHVSRFTLHTSPALDDAPTSAARRATDSQWSVTEGLEAQFDLDNAATNCIGSAVTGRFVGGDPAFAPGRIGNAAEFDGRRFIDAGNVGDFGFFAKFSVAAWVFPLSVRTGTVVSRMNEAPEADGYAVQLAGGKVQANFVKRWLDDALRVETASDLTPNQWHHIAVTYDGSRVAAGVHIYIDGREQKLKVSLDELNQSFNTAQPFRIGSGGGPDSRFQGRIDDVRIYHRVLGPEEASVIATIDSLSEIAAIPFQRRAVGQQRKIRAAFLEMAAPETVHVARRDLEQLRKSQAEFLENLPTTMVMDEMATPRDTFVLVRGEYDKPGEKVRPGVPGAWSDLPEGAPRNRLGFARWLVNPSNPLTARVAVNQYWQMFFGDGLVKTAEDFGTRGEKPIHPELLDWLATEFSQIGWDVKALQKLIVMSATYRQSSKATPEMLLKDPENRWLARGPRHRLSAEMVRDQALALSGLLVEKLGGPSVKPYQPDGLWKDLSGQEYRQDRGEGLYRRSLYTFWKRTSAPPMLATFDASGREMCSVRRARTSTPLQALNLMNDVTFVEAARVLAQRMMIEGGSDARARLAFGFRLATARWPHPEELSLLGNGFSNHLEYYQTHPQEASALIATGESPRPRNLDPATLAAVTAVANLILNLDETIAKQ